MKTKILSLNNMDINIFVDQVFSNPPKPNNSIQLQTEDADNEYLFQLLINILLSSLIYKNYINDIKNINPNKLFEIKEYFKSFGFDIIISNINDLESKNTDYYCEIQYLGNDKYKFINLSNPYLKEFVFEASQKLESYKAYYLSKDSEKPDFFISICFKHFV